MPSIGVKLYSVFFKFMLKHRLQSRLQTPEGDASGGGAASLGVTSRPDEETAASANPSFTDGVATKDYHIDPLTSLSIRIFLPDTCLRSPETLTKSRPGFGSDASQSFNRRNSYGSPNNGVSSSNSNALTRAQNVDSNRRNSYGGSNDDLDLKSGSGIYRGYNPAGNKCRILPVMLQFHGGGFVSGSNDSVVNDYFCRRIAKLCDVIVLAVGYRLAPENKYPAAFEDGLKVLHWLAKQTNLAACSKSLGGLKGGGADLRKTDGNWRVPDAFGASMVEPWLAAHGDPSRTCNRMGDSACVMHGYSYDSSIPNESKQMKHLQVLGDSVSFGRFMNEPLSWEKWSTFSHKKYVEEAESYSRPGSVAQKKAFFEAHYKRKAAQKAATEQECTADDANGTGAEGQDGANNNNSSQRISLKLDSHLVVDEKMDMVRIPDGINDVVESGKENCLVVVAEDAKDQKQAEVMETKYSLVAPKKKPPSKKRFFSKYLCNLYGSFPTQEPDNKTLSTTVNTGIIGIAPGSSATSQNGEAPLKTPGAIEGVSKNPAATPPKNRRKKPTDPSVPGTNTTRHRWPIFSAVSKSSRNNRSQTSSK